MANREKNAIEILREAREKYPDMTFKEEQRTVSGPLMVYATYKGYEYCMGICRDGMELPCENFREAVEHILKEDDVYRKMRTKIDNPPYEPEKVGNSLLYILEMLIYDIDTKREKRLLNEKELF